MYCKSLNSKKKLTNVKPLIRTHLSRFILSTHSAGKRKAFKKRYKTFFLSSRRIILILNSYSLAKEGEKQFIVFDWNQNIPFDIFLYVAKKTFIKNSQNFHEFQTICCHKLPYCCNWFPHCCSNSIKCQFSN